MTFQNSCKPVTPSDLTSLADSLLLEVRNLNYSIISANLDSIDLLYSDISAQHVTLSQNIDKFQDLEISEDIYLQLDSIMEIIGFCLRACNDFHSEISVIESHIQSVRNEISDGNLPDSTLTSKLKQESSLLNDLVFRVSLRMNLLRMHLESYEHIDDEINTYLIRIDELNH
jgi:hypothetical protein